MGQSSARIERKGMTKLHTEERLRIWEEEICPRVFRNAQSSDSPSSIFIGAQPGAGKTRAVRRVRELIQDENLIYINPDDYRRYHPDYMKLLEEKPLMMPARTARASADWARLSIQYAIRKQYSTIVESTWGNPDKILQQIEEAREANRQIMTVALAVPPVFSKLSILERYYRDFSDGQAGRWVSPEDHDTAVESLGESVEALAECNAIDQFMVIGRDGDPYYLGDSGSLFSSAWSASAHRDLTQDEASSIARQTFELKKLVEEFDPDNQQALRAISDILMMPTILKLNAPKNAVRYQGTAS